jgi:hypothetical protein
MSDIIIAGGMLSIAALIIWVGNKILAPQTLEQLNVEFKKEHPECDAPWYPPEMPRGPFNTLWIEFKQGPIIPFIVSKMDLMKPDDTPIRPTFNHVRWPMGSYNKKDWYYTNGGKPALDKYIRNVQNEVRHEIELLESVPQLIL